MMRPRANGFALSHSPAHTLLAIGADTPQESAMEAVLLNHTLFEKKPPPTNTKVTLNQLCETCDTLETQDNLLKAIDYTFYLLRDADVELETQLKLWKIRLTLFLFAKQLNTAKREAINLNNALYDSENQNVLDSSDRSPQRVNPLPKNNNGLIDHELLVLLLRLKSAPNMNLVNEFYKLSYQLRLRSSAADRKATSKKLSRMSLDVMMVLVVNRAYTTLRNLLKSILHEISDNKEDAHYQNHASNMFLMWIIASYLILPSHNSPEKNNMDFGPVSTECRLAYERLQPATIDALKTVLSQVSPHLDESSQPLLEVGQGCNFQQLLDLLRKGSVTSRTICALLGIWDLQYCYGFELIQDKLTPVEALTELNSSISLAVQRVENMWSANYMLVYGIY